jgi:hypothetical protein
LSDIDEDETDDYDDSDYSEPNETEVKWGWCTIFCRKSKVM